MARKYELKRRAERQAETRRRIVEAAVELHSTVGPLRTTVSAIAERAGVQRHTFYRHFPDERSLGLACSALFMEEERPLPDPERWRTIPEPKARLRHGLGELYAYFEEHGDALAPIVRDAEVDPLTQEIFELRGGPIFARMVELLLEGMPQTPRVRAAVGLALDFHAWRCLRARGLRASEAAELMADVVICAAA